MLSLPIGVEQLGQLAPLRPGPRPPEDRLDHLATRNGCAGLTPDGRGGQLGGQLPRVVGQFVRSRAELCLPAHVALER